MTDLDFVVVYIGIGFVTFGFIGLMLVFSTGIDKARDFDEIRDIAIWSIPMFIIGLVIMAGH